MLSGTVPSVSRNLSNQTHHDIGLVVRPVTGNREPVGAFLPYAPGFCRIGGTMVHRQALGASTSRAREGRTRSAGGALPTKKRSKPFSVHPFQCTDLMDRKKIRLHPPSIRLIRKERLHDSMSSVSVSQPRLPSRRSTRRASRPHSPPERPVEGPGDWAVTGRRAADSSQTENPDGELQDKMVLGGSRSHPT